MALKLSKQALCSVAYFVQVLSIFFTITYNATSKSGLSPGPQLDFIPGTCSSRQTHSSKKSRSFHNLNG